MSIGICFFTLDYFVSNAILHLCGVMDVAIHRECCGGVAETYLYLFCADLLLGEERCMRMAERMESKIRGQVQSLFKVSKDVYYCGQRHRLGLIFERAEEIAVLRERNALAQERFHKFLSPCEKVLHGGR